MMAFDQVSREGIEDPNVRAAIDGLLRVSVWGNSYLVTMPLTYPSGTMVGVRVTPSQGGYWVSDFAMGYREAEGAEAQRSFGAHAGRMKDQLGVEYGDGHEIRLFARENQLVSAIRRIAYATHRVATKAYHSAPDWDEQEMGGALYQRLRSLFGDEQVKGDVTVVGASNIDWHFSAEVHHGARRIFFDVVTPHHSSVFSAVSKFTDIRRLGPQSVPVAVVDSIANMGKWLPLVSQEAEVIENAASEETLRIVVREAA